MSAAECACGCKRPAPNTALSPPCTAALRATLELAESIEPDLLDAIAKQLRHGSGGKHATSEPPLPYDPAASDAARELRGKLTLACNDTLPEDAPWAEITATIATMASWLASHVSDLAKRDDAGEIYHDVRHAVERCTAILDPPPEQQPAGDCPHCQAPMLAQLDADTATCRKCGTIVDGIAERRAQRIEQAEMLDTATAISGALDRLGIRVSAGVIRMWASRHRLTQRGDVYGQPAYALSDVLGLIAERDARKVG